MRLSAPALAGLLLFAASTGRADPTWPAPTDEMEEIIFQLQGFKGRLFNDLINPCNNEAVGPERVTAAEWLRVAFHDMATANRFTQTGGLDASLQFELSNGENTGPGHATTLKFYANYLSSRSSMADLIAAGTYASVRACGGPVIPLRLGRKDATAAGNPGVPQPQNSVVTFRQQFDRMGFTPAEMIQVTACGHTLGGVHTAEFPDLVPAGTGVNGQVGLDSTVASFDNKVVTEYINGTTSNPLVVGRSVALNRHSDFKVYNSDGNATMNAMVSPETFRAVCQKVLQKMIDVVPGGIVLTEPIAPYMVKPVDMQLTLASGNRLLLTGNIRVRTTELTAGSIENVVLAWKDRSGGNNCGSVTTCSATSTLQGVARGFDDAFGFFPISVYIPASGGISSFTVKINFKDGTSRIFDNNGHAYPMTDGIIFQKPQSCLLQGSGALTAIALVRNDIATLPVILGISYLTPRNTTDVNPVPVLNNAAITMTKGGCSGSYTFYSAAVTIPGDLSYNARISVTVGEGESAYTDDFNHGGALGGTCTPFTGATSCSNATTSIPPSVSSTAITSSALASSSAISNTTVPTSAIPSSVTSGTRISVSATPTPTVKPTVGGYTLVGCWAEGNVGIRALTGPAFAYDGMTLEACMSNCTGFRYWGTEYGRECYCGNTLHESSKVAPDSDCNMICSGNPLEYCGAGNRLSLYSTTSPFPSSTPTPTPNPSHLPTVGPYLLVGCQTEPPSSRALMGLSYASESMSLEFCAAFCSSYLYFGTEYSRECFCGNSLSSSSTPVALIDCSMPCAGNSTQYCGAGNRLQTYRRNDTAVMMPQHPESVVTPTSGREWIFAGCRTEGTSTRALSGKAGASSEMTLEECAGFCEGWEYFGTEYEAECYCGDGFGAGSVEVGEEQCGMRCSGDGGERCGDWGRLSVYKAFGTGV